ncbi:MAG: Xaa-Pro dipeptidyl-peptidase [Balneola sp.]|nr:Xaa-Pro dipeptidyl-peptidase [Balneola sp.]
MSKKYLRPLFVIAIASLLIFDAYAQTIKIPVIKDGQAQVIPEFENPDDWLRHDLWVETEFDTDGDGKADRMHVSVTRPKQTESGDLKLPVVYESSPYYAGTPRPPFDFFWDVKHELGENPPARIKGPKIVVREQRPVISNSQIKNWVPRGFIVVHSSSPGTGLSQGSPTVGGDNESLAPKAVIDWLNGRANGYTTPYGNEKVEAFWATGKVGMTGTSYNGTLPLAAATTGVEGLEAIIPIAPNTSYYHYYRSNGLVRSPGGYLGEDVDVLYDFIHSGSDEFREHNNRVYRDKIMANGLDRVTGDYNDFWASRDYLNDMKPLKAAVLMAHGFNDWNVMPEHSYRIYDVVRKKGVPHMVYYHQGGHGGEPPMELMNKWFTKFLFGIDNDVESLPKSWIVRENDDRLKPTSYADYPHPKAEMVTFKPTAGFPERGSLVTGSTTKQGTETFVDNVSFDGESLAKAEWTNHRLMFTTPVLSESVHISGVSTITVKLASNKPAANLSVWLVALPWEEGRRAKITDNIITRGWADPQNHKSLSESEPLKPGKFYTVTFDLQPDDQIIEAGQQIGLMIFSSDKDFTLHPDPGTEITVDLDGTSISIPVVNGKSAFTFRK